MDDETKNILTEKRAADKVDVCIVGGGPAGLAAAIKLKQLQSENEDSREIRVVVLEKAPDMGSHIVSGAVLEPRALRELFPDSEHYNEDGEGIPLPPEIVTLVEKETLRFLYGDMAIPLPEPPQMLNKGKNYIASLSEVVKHLSEKAEELGVEVYPSTSVSEVLYDSEGAVKGVATKDMGIAKDGTPKDSFERGMEFHARVTVFAEGCHGSLSKEVINKFKLRDGRQNQTYGLGIKEVWEVEPSKFKKGFIAHTLGYPLNSETYGGGFIYHFGDGLVAVGLVIGLDYKNPWISPFQEFQKMKHHPFYRETLEGGKCISYAARALNEGGWQSVPKLHFPGGVLVGATAGFMNVPKVKGTHTAMKSGMLAAECIYNKISAMDKIMTEEDEEYDADIHDVEEPFIDLPEFESAYKNSWIYEELYEVRNLRPSFNSGLGFLGGVCYSGLDSLLFKGQVAWTFQHHGSDALLTRSADQYEKIDYPKPDGKISFDILTSVSRTGTYHDEDEKNHLRIPDQDMEKHTDIAWPKFQGVENRFCPAGVYEYVADDISKHGVKFQINSQNCIHCKTCDIKVPTQDINWTVPEGGDGPKYVMT
jgi:electron-transferring-flavoprotein dehydrogenase